MPIYSLDFSDDEDEHFSLADRYFYTKPTDNILVHSDEEIMADDVSETDEEIMSDGYTDTEDDMSVDLDDCESEDEQDLIDGEEEYEKFKHTLLDFIVDEMIEDGEEYQPKHKRNKIDQ